MRNLFHILISRCVNLYKRAEGVDACRRMGYCGKSTSITAPKAISHPELIRIGQDTTILADARMQVYPELSNEGHPSITIGTGCFFGYRICMLAAGTITIGDHVLMASDITLCAHNHGMDPESDIPYMDQPLTCAPITIADDCWIGDKVIVLPGVTIGKGSIIGAGSVVTKDVPEYSIAVGNPARVVKRYNFENKTWERA